MRHGLATAQAAAAGRMCPVDYRYDASVLARPPEFSADVLYVIGGLYGNLAALAEIERLASAEAAPVPLVFNGDFHWFDADPDWFAAIERGVGPHRALRGNVETEIARAGDIGAGCGCAYPEAVDDGVVTRSNDILTMLRDTAARLPGVSTWLAALPMHLVAAVGDLRIGIVHGDAVSLAGWRFAQDALDQHAARAWLAEIRDASNIDIFASTHTCLAALRDVDLPGGRVTVINNGAAGMPNFAGERSGLISRIATSPSPHRPSYGITRDGVHIDAIPVMFDDAAFRARFDARWPPGTPAHLSYAGRIADGPDHSIARAAPR